MVTLTINGLNWSERDWCMPQPTYYPSDRQPLNGGIRVLGEIGGLPCIEINSAGEAFARLATADDVPSTLRRFYEKVGKKLTDTGMRLKKYLDATEHEAINLSVCVQNALGRNELSEKDMERLRHVNTRLQALEKVLQDKLDEMHERLEGLNPAGVEWDRWDGTDIVLWLSFESDSERPSYNADAWADDGIMEPLEIRVKLGSRRKRAHDKEPWGLDDGKVHSDLGGFEGSQLRHFHQCYLFHELLDHVDVSVWGMLHLQSIWIEVIPHRSGDFVI